MLVVSASICAQNLVPNPSFESVACPDNWMEPFSFGAEHWYNPTGSTPDYMGLEMEPTCYSSIYNNAWLETGEWQYPQDGQFMIGMFSYIQTTCIREYAACRLTEPLQAGVVYVASMHVSLSNTSTASTDGLGMYLSADSLSDINSFCDFDVVGQIQNTAGNQLTDTTNWVLIEGEFMAQGGEQFLMIGNILSNENCEFETLYEDSSGFVQSYYFVDNVLVEEKSSVGVDDEAILERFQLYPNPASTHVMLPVHDSKSAITIRDYQGRVCFRQETFGRRLDISSLERGNYVVEVRSDQEVKTYRLVKE